MRGTKNVFIHTDDAQKDIAFREKEIKEKKLDYRDVYTDISFESSYNKDVANGLCGWKQVRMVNANGEEKIYDG